MDVSHACVTFELDAENLLRKLERATGFEPQPPAWELKLRRLYFHNLQNRSGKINIRVVSRFAYRWGRLGDVMSDEIFDRIAGPHPSALSRAL